MVRQKCSGIRRSYLVPDGTYAYPAYELHTAKNNVAAIHFQLFGFTDQLP